MEYKAAEPFDIMRLTSLATAVPQKNPTFWLASSFILFTCRMGLILSPVFFWLLYENIAPELSSEDLYLVSLSIILIAGGLTVFAMLFFWMIQSVALKIAICGQHKLIEDQDIDIKSLILDKSNLLQFVSWRAFRLVCLLGALLVGAAPGMGFWLLGYVLEMMPLRFVGGAFAFLMGSSSFLFCYSFIPLGDWILLSTGPTNPIDLTKKCWSISKGYRAQMLVYQLCTLTLAIFGLCFCVVGSAPVMGIGLYGWTESLLKLSPLPKEEDPIIKRTALSSGVSPNPSIEALSNTPEQHSGSQHEHQPISDVSHTPQTAQPNNPTAQVPQFNRNTDLKSSYPRDFFDTQAGPGPRQPPKPPAPAPPPPPRRKKR